MNTTWTTFWNPHLNIDSVANGSMLAAGLLIVVMAAATADTDPVSEATLVVQQDPDSRIVTTAVRPRTEVETAGEHTAAKGDSVLLAASSFTDSLAYNKLNPKGDSHAR